MIEKHGQPSSEAFQSIVSKVKLGDYIAMEEQQHRLS
jgi:hypothetical protein